MKIPRPSLKMLLLLATPLASIVGGAGCSSTQRQVETMTKGTCQANCQAEHPDSLYDRNMCLDDCESPPPD